MKMFLAATSVAMTIAAGAQAALVVDISGDVGLGFVSVDFSGSATASSGTIGNGLAWDDLGDFTDVSTLFDIIEGNAEVNVYDPDENPGVTSGISGGSVTDGGSGGVDGFQIDLPSGIVFEADWLVSWSSNEVIANTGITSLFSGTTTTTFFATNAQGLDLELTFTPKTAVVPLPASLPLALLGLAALGVIRRSRKA